MLRPQRLKYEMFVRVRNFGISARDVFPAESGAGKKFGQLTEQVKVIEQQLVRQGQARAEARKIKLDTRKAAMDLMKAVASAGRRAATAETLPHPFRLPRRRAATIVLASARPREARCRSWPERDHAKTDEVPGLALSVRERTSKPILSDGHGSKNWIQQPSRQQAAIVAP